MEIPHLHIGHTRHSDGKEIIVKNAVYNNDSQLEMNFPHKHSFYMICLIHDGNGVHVVDFEEIEVLPGRLFFLNPEQVHFWKLNSAINISLVQFAENMMHFKKFGLDDYLSPTSLFKKNFIDLDSEQVNAVLDIFLKLDKEALEQDIFSTEIMRGYLHVLTGIIWRLINADRDYHELNSKEEKLREFLTLLNQHYARQKGVSFYAGQLNISANYLNTLTRQLFRKSASDIISQKLLIEAKRLLYHSSSDISQVAFNLGFDDPSYFTRFFKKETNLTPSAFRELIYKKYQHPNN